VGPRQALYVKAQSNVGSLAQSENSMLASSKGYLSALHAP
jgi:hypothetical protein